MSLFSNDMRVANTAAPSFQSQANVGQYGWTGADQGHYNQLLQYVDECRKIWINLEEKITYVEGILDEVENIDAQVKYIELIANEVQKWRQEVLSSRDQVSNMYNELLPLFADFTPKYTDFTQRYDEVVQMHTEVHAANQEAHEAAEKAEIARDEARDIAEELRKGQVYRGTWNIQANARYPDRPDTNSVWDIVLNEGALEYQFDNTTWYWGDRLLYLKDDNAFTQIEAGGSVTSVNGKKGAVTLTATDVGAPIVRSNNAIEIQNHEAGKPVSVLKAVGDTTWITNGDDVVATDHVGIGVSQASGPIFYDKGGDTKAIYHEGRKPTAADVGALSLSGGTVRGQTIVEHGAGFQVRDGGDYGIRMVNSGTTLYHQTGKMDRDVNDQKLAMTGWYGTPLSFFRVAMAEGKHAYIQQAGVDYRIYHQGYKPTAADVGAASSGFGLGEEQAYTVADMDTDPLTWNGGKMGWIRAISSTLNRPEDQACVGTIQRYQSGPSSIVHIVLLGHNNKTYSRRWSGSAWANWKVSYDTSNKPTAADVGAVPVSDVTSSGEFGKIPKIGPSGVTEMGNAIDFHYESAKGDFNSRLNVTKNPDGTNYTLNVTGSDLAVAGNLYEKGSRVYSEGYRPTAGGIGAVASEGNGRINGNLELTGGLSTQTGVTINGTGNVQAMFGGYLRCNTDSVMSMDGKEYSFVTSKRDVHLCNNSYWNGRDWLKYEDSVESHYIVAKQGGLEHLWSDAGNSNPNQYRSQILSGHNTGYVSAASVLVPEAGNGWIIADHELLVYKFPQGVHVKGIIRRSPAVGKVNDVIFYLHANAKVPYSTFLLDKSTVTAPSGWSYTENINFQSNAVSSGGWDAQTGWIMVDFMIQFQ